MKYLFVLFGICYTLCIKAAITTPALFSPSDNSTFTTFSTSISARTVANATGYQFQLDTVPSFQSGAVTQYSAIPTNPPQIQTVIGVSIGQFRLGKQYFWRSRAYAPSDTSAWSSTWKFTIVQGQLNLNSPSNNSSGPIQYLISFNMGIDSVGSYLFEADTSASFSSPLRVLKFIRTPVFQDSNLFEYNRTIYWRATYTNGLGDTLLWSSTRKYTIHSNPTINILPNQINTVDPEYIVNWNTAGLGVTQVQADTLSNFSSPYLQSTIIPSGTLKDTLSNLLFDQLYYLRIRSIYGTDTSAWSPLGIIKPRSGNINNPSFNGETMNLFQNITFGWRQLQGARVRFILYADSSLSTVLKDTITSLGVYRYAPALSLHKWYQVHVTYFHETDTTATLIRHFRIYNGVLSLSTPVDNATNLIVRPRFTFQAPIGFTQLVLEIDSGSTFPTSPSTHFQRHTSFDTAFGTTLFKTINPLHYNQRYVWRVYGILHSDTGASTIRSFTTAAQPANHFPPTNFIGLGTASNALVTSIDSSVSVQWELDTAIDFSSPIKLSGTNPAIPDEFEPKYVLVSLSDTMLFHTKYFWRTRCINQVDTSNWSFVFNFTTTTNMQLSTPPNGAVNVPIKVPLNWSIQGSNLTQRYQYQIGTDSTFATSPIITLGVNEFSEDTFTAAYSTKYYWRARACNSMDTSKWSVRFSFTTVAAPVVGNIVLGSPANNATILPGLINFSWVDAVNATGYDVQVSTSQDFGNIVASGTPSSTGVQWDNARPRTKYYWRVRGKNDFNIGSWSIVSSFNTTQPVSIGEMDELSLLNIYPNPTSRQIYIKFPTQFSVSICDMNGKILWESKSSNSHFEIDLESLDNGIYMIEVETIKGKTYRKIVVQH
jgi:hypothetical protein